MPPTGSPRTDFLRRLEESVAPLGFRWKRSTQQLYRASREPQYYVHFNLGVYPGHLVVTPTAWAAFSDVEVVASRVKGRTLAEARRAAKDGATIGRSLGPVGGWDSYLPDYSDVIDTVREALNTTAASFFDECESMERAARLYDDAMRAPVPGIVLDTHHSPSRHLALLYLLRDRRRFEAAVAGWIARGEQFHAETQRVAAFLQERWGVDLTKG